MSSLATPMKLNSEPIHPTHASGNRPSLRPALVIPRTPMVYPGRKHFNLYTFTASYREKNSCDDRVTKAKAASAFKELVLRKFPEKADALSFQDESPLVWQYWCEVEAIKNGYVTRREPLKELHIVTIRDKDGCSSNSMFETTSNQIVLVPAYSLDSLHELEYATFVQALFEVNLALNPDFKLGRMEVFWIWHALIMKVYYWNTEEVKEKTLAKAIGAAANEYWVDKDESPLLPYVQPSKQATRLNHQACKSALVLPDCAFLYHSNQDFGTYDRFVPAFLCVNHLSPLGRERVDKVWGLVLAQRCNHRRITQFVHARKVEYTKRAEQTYARELWKAIDFARKQTLEEGPTRESQTPFVPTDVMFNITKFNKRIPLAQPDWTSDQVFVSFMKQLNVANNATFPRNFAEIEWLNLGWKASDMAWAKEQARLPVKDRAVDEYFNPPKQAMTKLSDVEAEGAKTPLLLGAPTQVSKTPLKRKLDDEHNALSLEENEQDKTMPMTTDTKRLRTEETDDSGDLFLSPGLAFSARDLAKVREARLDLYERIAATICDNLTDDLDHIGFTPAYDKLSQALLKRQQALQTRVARRVAADAATE